MRYIENYRKKSKPKGFKIGKYQTTLSRKQIIALAVLLISIITSVTANAQFGGVVNFTVKFLSDVFAGSSSDDVALNTAVATQASMQSMFSFVDIAKACIQYIVQAQVKSASIIGSTTFGSKSMFSHIQTGLTIFACIACAYKIVVHYAKTERFDNVSAITGFFSYIGVLILFLASNTIVDYLVGLNQNINTSAVTNIGAKIENELNRELEKDYKLLATRLNSLDKEYEELNPITDVATSINNRVTYMWAMFGEFYLGNLVKYAYYSVFGIIITSVLAIPAFVLTFMVKVLLSVMIAGTKLVFLLAFIPGFEKTWQQFILNLINILLWIPIFNAIIAFILQIISGMMTDDSMNSGQIIWLSIVSIVLAYQSISLTTTGAGVIINGTGAGMAGALGSLGAMNATSVTMQVASQGAQAIVSSQTGGKFN